MNRAMIYGWTAMTLLGLLAGAAVADDGGLIRISDSPPPSAGTEPGSSSKTTPAPGTKANPGTNATPGMEAGTQAANGGVPCEGGGDVGRCRLCGCLKKILAYNPAAGFRAPEIAAIDRDAVMYYRYWPAKWYGEPGYRLAPSFPMVYMPTDTTQLGVYYARVPQWLPNPRMYPRPPRPDQWNRRVVRADHTAGGAGSCYGGMTAEAGPLPVGAPTPDALGSPVMPPGGKVQSVPQQEAMPPVPKMLPAPAPLGT